MTPPPPAARTTTHGPHGRRLLARAADVLRAGGLVAVPTETVYGLAADASNPAAVGRIFQAKGRPADHPLIVHLPDLAGLPQVAARVPPWAWVLAARFWPGPLTLILSRTARVAREATGGLDTVGVRVPDHALTRALLYAFGGWIAAPSANRFRAVSPTTADHVRADLGDRVDLILDGGPCAVGVESTICDATGATPRVLRPGAISAAQIAAATGLPVTRASDDDPVRAPGQLAAHYQPRATVEVVPAAGLRARADARAARGLTVYVLARTAASLGTPGTSPEAGAGRWRAELTGEAPEGLARRLYAALRAADGLGAHVVVVERPAPGGIGDALLDRLQRAAHGKGLSPP